MKSVVAFGEIMLRLKSPGFEPLFQSPVFEATFGGGEANVLASLTNYGINTKFVSAVPDNPVGAAALRVLRSRDIDTGHVKRSGERLGIYFLEAGANQRPSKVVYDRSYSSIASVRTGEFNWKEIFQDTSWFHFTGITPALSASTAAMCSEAIQAANDAGIVVSCDLNYRAKLWKYGKKAPEVMRDLIRNIDVVIANEEDCQQCLGIRSDADVHSGQVPAEAYLHLCEQVLKEFPSVKKIAITLRESKSATRNGWSACLHNTKEFLVSQHYEIESIVDRVGTGDSFAGGLIYGLLSGYDDHRALNFATAAACLKHSVPGDFHSSSVRDVESLMHGEGSGRVQR